MLRKQLERLRQALEEEDYERAIVLLEAMIPEAEREQRALRYQQHAQRRHQQRELSL